MKIELELDVGEHTYFRWVILFVDMRVRRMVEDKLNYGGSWGRESMMVIVVTTVTHCDKCG